MFSVRLVFVTVPKEEVGRSTGRELAETLVKEKLVACVSRIKNVESTYMWEGKLYSENEEQLIMKTTQNRVEELKKRIKELHPYEVPEILALDVSDGSEEYLKWVKDSTDGY